MNKPLTFISLFAGIGGFDLGFHRAGMECLAQVEFDEKASAVLAAHYPNVKQFKDVKDVGKHNLPAVDLICGGFPCQDVSVAGKREGLAGNRSGLWFEFLRIIGELTPKWVVIENVPGLLSSAGGRDFAVIVRGLVECGYRVSWRVLDSQHFGVPQRRRRVFIVGSLGDGSSAEILFESESVRGDTQPCTAAGQGTPAYAIKGAAIGRKPENGPQRGEVSEDASFTLNATEVHAVATPLTFNSEQTPKHARNVRLTLRAEYQAARVNVVTFRKQRSDEYIPASVGSTLAARDHKDNGDVIVFDWQAGAESSLKISSDVCLTLKNSVDSYGGFAPAVQQAGYLVRRLTPTECERLQGFPDGWTAVNGQSDSARYKQLGNAVTVNVAEWIGKRIVEIARTA